MKLDDRPVIDQLLNPTPLNILAEVVQMFLDRICSGELDRRSELIEDFAGELEARL